MSKNIVFLLECNATQEKEKIKISPIGEFIGVDGRKYILDATKVINNTKNIGCDLMLDKDHEDKEAMGWFSQDSLEVREDGIYASLELNSLGKNLVKNRIYRYLSPAYSISGSDGDTMIVDKIVNIGLVNRPNLLFHSLNNNNQTETRSLELKKQIETLEKENKELRARIEQLQKEREEAENNSIIKRIEDSIARGEMLPNRKEAALTLKNAALDNYMEVCKEEAKFVLQNKKLDIQEPNNQQEIDESIREQLGI